MGAVDASHDGIRDDPAFGRGLTPAGALAHRACLRIGSHDTVWEQDVPSAGVL